MTKEKLKVHSTKESKQTDLADKLLGEFENRRAAMLNNQAVLF